MSDEEETPISDWSIHAVRKERDQLRARVAELEAENAKLVEHAIQIEHRLTKEMSGRIDAAVEHTARECIEMCDAFGEGPDERAYIAAELADAIRQKFGVTG